MLCDLLNRHQTRELRTDSQIRCRRNHQRFQLMKCVSLDNTLSTEPFSHVSFLGSLRERRVAILIFWGTHIVIELQLIFFHLRFFGQQFR